MAGMKGFYCAGCLQPDKSLQGLERYMIKPEKHGCFDMSSQLYDAHLRVCLECIRKVDHDEDLHCRYCPRRKLGHSFMAQDLCGQQPAPRK